MHSVTHLLLLCISRAQNSMLVETFPPGAKAKLLGHPMSGVENACICALPQPSSISCLEGQLPLHHVAKRPVSPGHFLIFVSLPT